MDERPQENDREGRTDSGSGRVHTWGYDLTFFQRVYARLHRVLCKWLRFRLYLVHSRPIVVDEQALAGPGPDYRFAEPPQEQVLQSLSGPVLHRCLDFGRESFRRGDRCFVAVNRGDFVGYYWTSTSGAVPLTEELAFAFDPCAGVYCPLMFVHPRCRGRRLYQALVAYGDRELSASGHTHVIGCVESQNFSSRKALARIPGLRLVGVVGAFGFFGRLVTFRSPGARRRGFAIRALAPSESAAASPSHVGAASSD